MNKRINLAEIILKFKKPDRVILVTTTDIEPIDRNFADQIVMMYSGNIVWSGKSIKFR